MISPVTHQTLDDTDLDDEALWAVIDSAAAVSSSKSLKPQTKFLSPKITFPIISSPPSSSAIVSARPKKIARVCGSGTVTSPSGASLAMVKRVEGTVSTPKTMVSCSDYEIKSPGSVSDDSDCSVMTTPHSLAGRFPTVAIFKEYQNAAMAILEKGDYTMIHGNPCIKNSGWRKISFYFNISYEFKHKTIEFDVNRDVQHAEFIVRAQMQGGRFSDGWGSCERHEKRFSKPNHDIPSTAETRAKNKACQKEHVSNHFVMMNNMNHSNSTGDNVTC